MKRNPRTPGSSKKKAAGPVQSHASSMSDLSGRRQTSVHVPSHIEKFKELANRCHTPAQFKTLLYQLEKYIPYERFACGWGNPALYAVSFFYTRNYPKEFLNWYLTTGMLSKDPVFTKWLSTHQGYQLSQKKKRQDLLTP